MSWDLSSGHPKHNRTICLHTAHEAIGTNSLKL